VKIHAHRLLTYLGIAFFAIWVVIGIFLLLVIVQGFRRGAYAGLLTSSQPNQSQQAQPQDTSSQQPTEADLPGIGKVNIACVQQALSPDSLQKVLQSKDVSVLNTDERTKFQLCITQPVTATPSASPQQ